MQGQEPGTNLFCIYRDCEDLALFGDYCKAHQFQRAEAAESRAAQAEAEIKNAGEAYAAKVYTVTELQRIVSEVTSERDELRTKLNEALAIARGFVAERDELARKLEQAQRKIASATDRAQRALNQAINEGEGVYRP